MTPFERAVRAASQAYAAGADDAEIVRVFARRLGREENPVSRTRARLSYIATHWGLGVTGGGGQIRCADPRSGAFTKLGDLTDISYATVKGGDGGPAIYDHEFRSPLPELLYSASSGWLLIAGGGYRVGIRGIVG